jgi:hypothetical protein
MQSGICPGGQRFSLFRTLQYDRFDNRVDPEKYDN